MSQPGTRKHYRVRQWQAKERQPRRGRSKQYDQTTYDANQEEVLIDG